MEGSGLTGNTGSDSQVVARRNPTFLTGAIYLVVTAPFLVIGAPSVSRWLLLAAHLVASAALLTCARRFDPDRATWVDWIPLLAIPLIYAEIQILNRWVGTYFDPVVQGWEASVFPSNPSRTFAGAFPFQAVSEAVHLGYLSYYPLIYLPQLRDFVQGRARRFHQMMFALVATFAVCYLLFVVFPVQGPRYLWTPDAPAGPARALTLALLESGSSRGAAFPSSHVAVATVQAFSVVRYRMAEAWLVVPLAGLLTVGTVYGGFHYAVDASAGIAVGLIVGVLSLRLGLVETTPG